MATPASRRLNLCRQGSCGERACPALGCEAAPVKTNALYQALPGPGFGAAAQPNAGQARSLRGRFATLEFVFSLSFSRQRRRTRRHPALAADGFIRRSKTQQLNPGKQGVVASRLATGAFRDPRICIQPVIQSPTAAYAAAPGACCRWLHTPQQSAAAKSWQTGRCGERACPALGCEAAPVKTNALYQALPGLGFGAAAQPSAGQARSPRGRFATLEFVFSLSFSRQRRSTRRHPALAAGGFIRRSKTQQLNPGKQGVVASGLAPRWAAKQPQ
ncbi:hypothetical protein SAMN04490205_4118 [Pseudomonas trivialis]|uniref:Uncharacterized protein n=1 Tax=Pseudomonas trivialis TaxID=200450 RepID=A0ABY0UMR5_9PSED|nr:hypothetical protein SAMN04490205_4118 [Pseudomonas trivialis]